LLQYAILPHDLLPNVCVLSRFSCSAGTRKDCVGSSLKNWGQSLGEIIQYEVRNVIKAAAGVMGPGGVGMIAKLSRQTSSDPQHDWR
jgi:hypothetical protein